MGECSAKEGAYKQTGTDLRLTYVVDEEETDRQRLGSDYLRGRRCRCSLDKIASQYQAPEDPTAHMGRHCSPYSRRVGMSQKHPLRTFPPERKNCVEKPIMIAVPWVY